MSKFKPFHNSQKSLLELSKESLLDYIEKTLPQDHLCRLVKKVVNSLDTSGIELKYSHLGQNTYHPKLLLSVLFYGYATGVRSSRKLEDKSKRDFAFIYLMQGYTPDHSTVSDFRKDNIGEIEKYFVNIVRLLSKLGVKEAGKLSIYLDGTKIKSNASARRSKDIEGFKKWLSNLEEEINKILQEAEEIDKAEDEKYKIDKEHAELKKKLNNRKYLKSKIEEALKEMKEEDIDRMNLTDNDAKYMKDGGSKDIRPSYNCQAAVTESGIILAANAVMEPNDSKQLEPMIEQVESNTNQQVKEVAADSGYGSYSNYEYLEKKEIDGYVRDIYFKSSRSKEENPYHHTKFKYNALTDSYLCPEGKLLKYSKTRKKTTKKRKWNHKVYKGTECVNCSKRVLCTKAEKRELLIEIREPLLRKMREKLLSKEGALKYFKRQYTIEPVFGHLKHNIGYRNFLLRGVEKATAEFKLMCIGWNLQKMHKLGIQPAIA